MEQNKQGTDIGVMSGADFPGADLLARGELAVHRGLPVGEQEIRPVRTMVDQIGNSSLVNTLKKLPSKSAQMARTVKVSGLEIARAAKTDVKESEHKFRALASLLGVAAVEAVGITRAPTILSLPAAVKVQKETGIPVVAGIAAGSLYGAWSYTAARVINSGVNHLPRTFEAANAHLPGTNKLSSILPGLEPSAEQKVRTRAGRGLAVYSTGISLYIMAAGLQNQTQLERRKLCANIGRDGGTFLGSLAMAATGAVLVLQQKEPELAGRILEHAGDSGLLLKILIGATAAKMTAGWAVSKIKKRRGERRVELKPVLAT